MELEWDHHRCRQKKIYRLFMVNVNISKTWIIYQLFSLCWFSDFHVSLFCIRCLPWRVARCFLIGSRCPFDLGLMSLEELEGRIRLKYCSKKKRISYQPKLHFLRVWWIEIKPRDYEGHSESFEIRENGYS